MSLYSYVVKTPFNQMVADWNEYWNLRQRARLLRGERDFRYKQISENYGDVDVKCIRSIQNVWKISVMYREKTGEQRMFRPVYSARYCEEFFKGNCDGVCPRGFQHDRYWKMNNDLKVVQNALAEFWDKKFQNIK